ncbi:hypothetical protein AB0I66_42410 [Streptomyces sp. NPDC050439]|uniref:hypothetical protein n=1 Tax=unclassified Streptomyces TaxID=2593676 RepID=UPI0034339706
MSPSFAVRPKWLDLPEAVRAAFEDAVGARVLTAASSAGGFTPAMAGVLRLSTGARVFVKAVGPGSPRIAAMMGAEQRTNRIARTCTGSCAAVFAAGGGMVNAGL